jgi:ankyrin repeat protein
MDASEARSYVAGDIEANSACLLDAVSSCDWHKAEHLISNCSVNPNLRDKAGKTIFHIACEQGNLDVASLLLKNGADIEAKYNFGRTALHVAGENGRDSVLSYLIKAGANIEAKDNVGRSVLQRTSYRGYLSLATLLLDAGADSECRDETGSFPLHSACEKGHTHITSLLLDRACNIDCRDNFGRSPLHLSCLYDHLDTVTWLCDKGASLNIVDVDGRTPLHVASFKDHTEIVSYLLSVAANIDCAASDGRTPLHCAAVKGHTETIYLLLENDANIEARDVKMLTPLLCACEAGQLESASILLDRGADIEAKDSEDKTAMQRACAKGQWRVTSYLRDRGAVISSEFAAVEKALRLAHFSVDKLKHVDLERVETEPLEIFLAECAAGNMMAVGKFLDEAVDVNKHGIDGLAPLHKACVFGNADVAMALLDHGADIERRTRLSDSRTALHCAAENGHVDLVYALLNRTADVDALTSSGKTALYLVCDWAGRNTPLLSPAGSTAIENTCRCDFGQENCYNRHVELACALLEFGANSKLKPALSDAESPCEIADVDGNLILHRALIQRTYLCSFDDAYFVNIVLLLLKAYPEGARVRNKSSQLPLNIALENDAAIDVIGPLVEATNIRRQEINGICRSALYSSWCNVDSLHYMLYALQRKSTMPSANIHICGDAGAGKTTLRYALIYSLRLTSSIKTKSKSDSRLTVSVSPGSVQHDQNSTSASMMAELEPLSWLGSLSPARKVRLIDVAGGRSAGVSVHPVRTQRCILHVHDFAGRKGFRPLFPPFLAKTGSVYVLVLCLWDNLNRRAFTDEEVLATYKEWILLFNTTADPVSGGRASAPCIIVLNTVSEAEVEKGRQRRIREMLIEENLRWTKVSHFAWHLPAVVLPSDYNLDTDTLSGSLSAACKREEPTKFSGYMLRQSEVQKTWKRRYYVLHLGVLRYFDSDPSAMITGRLPKNRGSFSAFGFGESSTSAAAAVDSSSHALLLAIQQPKPLGEIFLQDYSLSLVSDSRLLLRNNFRKQRELLLEVEDGEERNTWVAAFRAHFAYLRETYRIHVVGEPISANLSLTTEVSNVLSAVNEAVKSLSLAPCKVYPKRGQIVGEVLRSSKQTKTFKSLAAPDISSPTLYNSSNNGKTTVDAQLLPPVLTIDSFKLNYLIPALRQLRTVDPSRVDDCVFHWLSALVLRQMAECGDVLLAASAEASEGTDATLSPAGGGWVVTESNWLTRDVFGKVLSAMLDGPQLLPMLTAPQMNALVGDIAGKYFQHDDSVLPQMLAAIALCVPMSDITGPYVPQKEELLISGSSYGMILFPMFIDLLCDRSAINILSLPSQGAPSHESAPSLHSYRRIVRTFQLRRADTQTCTFPPGYFPALFTAVAELEHNTRDLVMTSDSLVIQRCYSMCGSTGNIVQIIVMVDPGTVTDADEDSEQIHPRAPSLPSFTVTVTTLMAHPPTGRSYAWIRMQSIIDLIYGFNRNQFPVCRVLSQNTDESATTERNFHLLGPETPSKHEGHVGEQPANTVDSAAKGDTPKQSLGLVLGWLRNVDVVEFCVHPSTGVKKSLHDTLAALSTNVTAESKVLFYGIDECGGAAVEDMRGIGGHYFGTVDRQASARRAPDADAETEIFFDILEQLN